MENIGKEPLRELKGGLGKLLNFYMRRDSKLALKKKEKNDVQFIRVFGSLNQQRSHDEDEIEWLPLYKLYSMQSYLRKVLKKKDVFYAMYF